MDDVRRLIARRGQRRCEAGDGRVRQDEGRTGEHEQRSGRPDAMLVDLPVCSNPADLHGSPAAAPWRQW
jgi:hypothetical protein